MKKIIILFSLLFLFSNLVFSQDKYFDDLSKLSKLKVTLSNNRASFYGQTDSNQINQTNLKIKTDVDGLAKSAFLLNQNDEIFIGSGGDLNIYQNYLIQDIANQSLINLQMPLSSGSELENLDLIGPQSGVFKIGFQINQAIQDGIVRVLMPAYSDDLLASDDIPDEDTFDYGSGEDLTVKCPNDQDGIDFEEFGLAEKSKLDIDGQKFHSFSCAYTGSGISDFSENPMIIGVEKGEGNDRRLINPLDFSNLESKKTFLHIQLINQSGQAVFSSPMPFLFNPDANVKVSVLPHLTFSLSGKSKGETVCGQELDVNSFDSIIDFGDLKLNYLTKAALNLVVSTNGGGGYAVSLIQSDQMGLNGQSCGLNEMEIRQTCIPDALVLGMDKDNAQSWQDFNSQYGLAYTLENVRNNQAVFNYTQGYRHLANLSKAQLPGIIMTNDETTHQDSINVCFGLNPPPSNVAGSYENKIFYTVTAKF